MVCKRHRFAICSLHISKGSPVNQVLLKFETHIQLGPTYAAELLGIAYSTYAQVRNGSRTMQAYTGRHIQALQLLPPDSLAQLIKEHVRGRS